MRRPRTDDDLLFARIVGRNVRRLRTEQNLSGQQLADAAAAQGFRIGRSTISEIETGLNRRAVTVDQLIALAAALDTDPTVLLTPSDTDTTPPGADTTEQPT